MKKGHLFRATIHCLLPLLFITLIVLSCTREADKRLPNVVIIFIDDMGYGDIGSYGATGYLSLIHISEPTRPY